MEVGHLFSPARGDSVSEDVALQIEAAIVGGKVQPGERLPSERDLQSVFQTGRGVIREALRALKQKGLIEVKKGAKGGAFIKRVEVTEASESLALLLKQRRIPLDYLVEFRESIDRTITTLAIARADDAQVEELVVMAGELEHALLDPEPEMKRVAELDRRLNIMLVKMTNNPVFEWVMRTIQLGFGSYDNALYADPYYREKTAKNWLETARAIAAREPLLALSFIGYHYVLLQRCLKEKNGHKML